MDKYLIREVLQNECWYKGTKSNYKCRVDQYRAALIVQGDTPNNSDETECNGIVNVGYNPSYVTGIQFLFNGTGPVPL